jgi:hypothetical protein
MIGTYNSVQGDQGADHKVLYWVYVSLARLPIANRYQQVICSPAGRARGRGRKGGRGAEAS